MTDPFEYDVFISFSSADEPVVKPLWQELCSSGLRVFWSDSNLKKEVGNSWFEVIEKSLECSRHMLLICSENSMNSKWVKREYMAFYDQCYASNSRRLIPVLTNGFKPNDLPLFLRNLQVGKLDDSQFIQEIIPLLGGINIEKLVSENKDLKEKVDQLVKENQQIRLRLKSKQDQLFEALNNQKFTQDMLESETEKKEMAIRQMSSLVRENTMLKEKIEDLTGRHKLATEEPVLGTRHASGREAQDAEMFDMRDPRQTDWNRQDVDAAGRDEKPTGAASTHQDIPAWGLTPETVCVTNLKQPVSEDDLRKLFSAAGKVKKVQIANYGLDNTIGFVEMFSLDDAMRAINTLNKTVLNDRQLTVKHNPPILFTLGKFLNTDQ